MFVLILILSGQCFLFKILNLEPIEYFNLVSILVLNGQCFLFENKDSFDILRTMFQSLF